MYILTITKVVNDRHRTTHTIPDVPRGYSWNDAKKILRKKYPGWSFTRITYAYLNADAWLGNFAGIDTKGHEMAKFCVGVAKYDTLAEIEAKEARARKA